MPSATIYFEDKEDRIIEKYSKAWDLSKYKVVKKMVRDYEKLKHKDKK